MLVGAREGQWGVVSWGEIAWGEMPDIGDGGIEAANHIAMYVTMQQSSMFCRSTPEPKVQLYIYIRNNIEGNLDDLKFGDDILDISAEA